MRWFVLLACLVLGLSQALAGTLTSVSLKPSSSTPGTITKHILAFTPDSAIPVDGQITVTYPAGFAFGAVSIPDANVDGTFAVAVSGQTLTIYRNNDGVPSPGSKAVTLVLAKITNATAGSYTVEVAVLTSVGAALDGPQTSTSFTLE
jgi:hypothetical protein